MPEMIFIQLFPLSGSLIHAGVSLIVRRVVAL